MASLRPMLRKWLAVCRHRVKRAVIGRIPMTEAEQIANIMLRVNGLFNAVCRAHGNIRAEIARDILHLPAVQIKRSRAAAQLEKLIDQRIYFGRDIRKNEALPELDAIAEKLAARIRQLKRDVPNQPVFVSPFHYVSQYANIYIVERLVALLDLKSLSVVSGVPRNQYGDDHKLIPGIKVLYTYGDANRNGLGVRVARALKRDGVVVLFSDVPPFTMHRYPMETAEVRIFGRSARVHNGVFRMGESFNALLLPFYLRFERGHFEAHIFDHIPLAAPDAPQRLANYIESALTDNYQQWTPGGHPAMYSFAPNR
nr:hypothetical protein [Caballeronia sp. GAWG1-1]